MKISLKFEDKYLIDFIEVYIIAKNGKECKRVFINQFFKINYCSEPYFVYILIYLTFNQIRFSYLLSHHLTSKNHTSILILSLI